MTPAWFKFLGIALSIPIAACATLDEPRTRRLMLSGPPSEAFATPGPGAPRVHIVIEPGAALRGVELREVVGYDVTTRTLPGVAAGRSRATDAGGHQEETADVVGRRVCSAPCGIVVDGRRGQAFVLAGPGISESARFALADTDGDVQLTVRPGRSGMRKAGVPLTGIGVVGMLLGAVLLGVEAATGQQKYGVGIAMLGVSAPMLGVGLGLLFAGGTTFTRTSASHVTR